MWEQLSQAVLDLAASPWALVVLLVCCWVDGFFPPVPSESLVIATATLTVAGPGPPLWAVVAVAAAGAFLGDLTAFAIGRRVPVDRLPLLRRGRGLASVEWARRSLERRGGTAVLAARYVPVGRVAVNVAAGAVGFPSRRFVGFAAIAAVTWALWSVLLGVAAGALLHDRPLLAVVVGVVVGTLLGLAVDAVASRRRRRQAGPTSSTSTTGAPASSLASRSTSAVTAQSRSAAGSSRT